MKVLIIGGTGLLGIEAAKLLVKDNHEIISFALPPKPDYLDIPNNMEVIYKDYLKLSDDELLKYMNGCDSLVFAAGIDERVEGSPPIYDLYYKYNISPLERLLPLAKKANIKSAVILGSYFSYFDKIWPKLNLTKHHPYIKSRVDQMNYALSQATDSFSVSVLEIPYVFGIQPGRKPVYTILVNELKKKKKRTYWPKGGTAMVTTKQVGEAMVGAIKLNKSGTYPLGYYNMTWKEMLTIFHEALGVPNKKIITIPTWIYKLFARSIQKSNKKRNIESGLNLVKFGYLTSKNQFISKELASVKLAVSDDDIKSAIIDSIKLSNEALENNVKLENMRYK